jgi:hypothetical protein
MSAPFILRRVKDAFTHKFGHGGSITAPAGARASHAALTVACGSITTPLQTALIGMTPNITACR